MITLLNSINKKPDSLFNNAVIQDKKKLRSFTFIPANIKQFLIYFLSIHNRCHFPMCSLKWRSFHLLTHFPAAKRETETVLLNTSNSNGYTDMKWNHSMISTPECKQTYQYLSNFHQSLSPMFSSVLVHLCWDFPPVTYHNKKWHLETGKLLPCPSITAEATHRNVVLDIWKSCLVNFCKFILVGHSCAVDT